MNADICGIHGKLLLPHFNVLILSNLGDQVVILVKTLCTQNLKVCHMQISLFCQKPQFAFPIKFIIFYVNNKNLFNILGNLKEKLNFNE